MELSPSEVGAIAEREVAHALARAGWSVFVPMFAPHSRVDLVALRAGELRRVQVKSGVLRSGVVTFRPFSNTGNIRRCYLDEVDAFGVYCRELDRVYLVPIEDTSARNCSLRLSPAANGQRSGVRYADAYEVTPPRSPGGRARPPPA